MDYHAWYTTFQTNLREPDGFPWHNPYSLTAGERDTIASSIQQFQLGEGSEGKALLKRAHEWAAANGEAWLVEAVGAFIREEQRHSAWLAAFMDREGIGRADRHWVDDGFRGVRKLGALETCLRVLATAEVIAVPYYRALGRATRSPLLQAICARILADEARHLRFQSENLARLATGRDPAAQLLIDESHRGFVGATALLVWTQHGRVLSAGGYSVAGLVSECLRIFDHMRATDTGTSIVPVMPASNTGSLPAPTA